MEYVLFLTYNCNLKCKYCFANEIVNNKNYELVISDSQLNSTIEYIRRDIDRTNDLKIKYILYTNGVLINKLPLTIIKFVNTVLISIDGEKATQDFFRGIGTFDQIIFNAKILKENNKNIIARLTYDEGSDIYKAVIVLENKFDALYWQIVSKSKFNDSNQFLKNYSEQIQNLLTHWINKLEQGIVINIIPFQIVLEVIIKKEKNNFFKCGCGHDLQAIDISGNVYLCDEYIGNKDRIIGNTNSEDYIALDNKISINIFGDCRTCQYLHICSGRCRKCLEYNSKEQIKTYCEMTKILIDAIYYRYNDIVSACSSFNLDRIFYKGEYLTELIP